MGLQKYESIRAEMKTGDVIAFGGTGLISEGIKFRTGSEVSHVATVSGRYSAIAGAGEMVLICESTTLNEIPDYIHGESIKGVQMQRLSDRLKGHKGEAWLVPLKVKMTMDQERRFSEFLFNHHSKRTPYDTKQAIGSAIDWWDFIEKLKNRHDYTKLFCSELIGGAFLMAGLLDFMEECNPSEMTPQDILDIPIMGKPILIKEREE